MTKKQDSIEYEIYAVIGEWLVSQLRGHDDAARAIFDAIVPLYTSSLKPNPVTHAPLSACAPVIQSKDHIAVMEAGQDFLANGDF